MRIGLSGPLQGHKDTILESVKNTVKFRGYEFDDTKRYLDLRLQNMGLPNQVYSIYMHSHLVTTCTTFDTIVYSKYLLDNSVIDEEQYIEVGKAWLQTMELYNVIFYLPPDEDEVITEEAAELWSLFDRAILKYDVPVVKLEGTSEEKKKNFMKVFL